jgi:hypothetical protein
MKKRMMKSGDTILIEFYFKKKSGVPGFRNGILEMPEITDEKKETLKQALSGVKNKTDDDE